MATVDDIVNAVITELSQVPGVATQLYAAGRIRQFVQDAIIMEQDEMWWPQLMWQQKVALDGTNGWLVDDLKGPISFIDEYTDIQAVFPDGSDLKLPELPQSINPFNIIGNGIGAQFISADSVLHRPLKVWPLNSTGSIVVIARQTSPIPVSSTDKVYIDPLLLQYDAAWMYAVDDGTVPAQVNKFQMLAQRRRKAVKANYTQHGLLLDPRLPSGTLQDDFTANTFTLNGPSVLG